MNTLLDEISKADNWEVTEGDKSYSGDQVISAYLKGKKDGLEQDQKLRLERLITNVNKSAEYTAKIFENIKSNRLNATFARLKINSWENFSIIIGIPENEFITENMLDIYNFATNLESELENDLYHLEFSFVGINEYFNVNSLTSDGYALKYKLS
ncbi:hypothetical protein P3G55_21025 [Leptospira sp. 96542]|nr:hypothetical protein [Leptospira sp. 96542]